MELTLERSSAVCSPPTLHRDWTKTLKSYREPSLSRSILEILFTIVPFVALWATAWFALSISYVLTLALTLPAAGLLVRLFMIQHDCGHGAFFRNRNANKWVGRVLGVFTLTPYDVWQYKHAQHHATSGLLDKRGIGDVATLTVEEYRARNLWGKLVYRLYRHPIVMFGLGPSYLFVLNHRLPSGMMWKNGYWPWLSTMTTNLGILAVCALMIWLVGLEAFLMVQIPITLLASSIGVWLFYIQHQFEDTYWESAPKWDHQDAALLGSSYYELPTVLRWFTANIGIHHVHHLMSRIPFYRLHQILKDYPELRNLRRINFVQSLSTIGLGLWDEHQKRMIRFRDLRLSPA